MEMADRTRQERWLRATGLLPPEMRGFTPAVEGDERPPDNSEEFEESRRAAKRIDLEYRAMAAALKAKMGPVKPVKDDDWHPVAPKWSTPAVPGDAPPSWDNVVRAYEDAW